MLEIKGMVSSIETLGTLDGPGVRIVVFMQGCNLRCGYCHNPETWELEGGRIYTPTELFYKILRYKPYFLNGGGVTFSGGEALLQSEFLIEVAKLCRENEIHVCLDTSGSVYNDNVKKLLEMTDLVLLDIKMTNDIDYLSYIGCKLDNIIAFLNILEEKGVKTWIRQVIIPTVNDSKENIEKLVDIVKGKSCIEKIQLLPFKKLAVDKYKELKIVFLFQEYPSADKKKTQELETLIDTLLKLN